MALTPATNRQIPDHSIMDAYNKSVYLGNSFLYSLGNTEITTTSETPLLYLANPSVSSSAFPSNGNWFGLFVSHYKIACLTTSQTAILRVYQNPTISGAGTSETPVNKRSGSATTSIATLQLKPSVSANGTLVMVFDCAAFESNRSDNTDLLIVDPGQSLLITVQASSSTTYIGAELGWYEL